MRHDSHLLEEWKNVTNDADFTINYMKLYENLQNMLDVLCEGTVMH